MQINHREVEKANGEFCKNSKNSGAILLPEEDGFRKMVAYKVGSEWVWINKRFTKKANGKNNKKKV
tara:strand:- start:6 stop:203 length:198 start_codon:yes stop_codon:yes gene_type:complete